MSRLNIEKVLAAGLAVFSAVSVAQSLTPNTAQAMFVHEQSMPQKKLVIKIVFLGRHDSGKAILFHRVAKLLNMSECFDDVDGAGYYRERVFHDQRTCRDQVVIQKLFDVTWDEERFDSCVLPAVKNSGIVIFTISLANGKFQTQLVDIDNFLEMFANVVPENASAGVIITELNLENLFGSAEDAKQRIKSKITSFGGKNLKKRVPVSKLTSDDDFDIRDIEAFIKIHTELEVFYECGTEALAELSPKVEEPKKRNGCIIL